MKEREIRPSDLFARFQELCLEDIGIFFSNKSCFVQIDCPGCASAKNRPAFEKLGFRYVECDQCGSLFTSPRPTPQALDAYYSNSASANYWAEVFFPAVAEIRRKKIFVPRVKQIEALLQKKSLDPKVVMDVGAGYGIFLEEYKKQFSSADVCAVEPGQKMALVCQGKGIETLVTTAEGAESWAGKADLVSCFEVIEHVFAPEKFVVALRRLLKPGGHLVISGLGVDGFDIQVLWDKSKSISPPYHLNFLSVLGFEMLFKRLGFQDIQVDTPGQLDVNIVVNALKEDSSISSDRFVRLLLRRNGRELANFQEFLLENRLSSHCRIFAKKNIE
jgi:SAM-dependent methyltransferase